MTTKVNEPLVSISCLAFNHVKFIRKALEGFIMQETTFPFEVLIHDDASTDGTAEIIREYEGKFPGLIKPIYQKENQWKKGFRGSAVHNFPGHRESTSRFAKVMTIGQIQRNCNGKLIFWKVMKNMHWLLKMHWF
jgi:glycosyltransferase involved in cell wall biosynthesis